MKKCNDCKHWQCIFLSSKDNAIGTDMCVVNNFMIDGQHKACKDKFKEK